MPARSIAQVALLVVVQACFVRFACAFFVPDAYDQDMIAALKKAPGLVLFCDDRRPAVCAQAKSVYGQVGKAFAKHKDVAIVYTQCDGSHAGCVRYQVKDLPALRWIPKGGDPVEAEQLMMDLRPNFLISEVETRTGLMGEKAPPTQALTVALDRDNFDQIVMDPKRDVFVDFYAPWCQHCKALKPKFEDIARIFAPEKHVVIAMLDAEANKDIGKKYNVRGYPTLLLFKRGEEKQVVKFEGARQLPQLIEFLNEHVGAHYAADGSLTERSGVALDLSLIVADFIKDGALDTEAAAKVKELMQDSGDSEHGSFEYYAHLLDKLVSRGRSFLELEHERLRKMFTEAGTGIAENQLNHARRRINILESIRDEL
ncbi:Protein disulfide-isomerase like 2-1 [Porphyridium purpureum]|uniref:protein disulfide-isomerase n=1 Tax=Porphyridium purpureum TaxID=35688 RepID=A0A5J4Z104_PORPP|nr:Protein disulfide-isomerase like 2-1 [Porphyridium purpureum]|eukprot:POR0790..scf295_1